jgi:hypothetical protein
MKRVWHIILHPMPRVTRPLLAIALFACAAFVRAESLHVVAPAIGATLRGGAFAELRWSTAQLPASTEEWEAFLSIDGGKYYAFRITPHLDINLQRFTFIVPNVDTHAARILIRTGDEVHETHYESRSLFSIVRDPDAELVVPRLLQFGRGEAARDGDPAVLSWTEGTRNGSNVTQQSSTTVPSRTLGRIATVANDEPPVIVTGVLEAHIFGSPVFLQAGENRANRRCEPIHVDLLLACRRRNV